MNWEIKEAFWDRHHCPLSFVAFLMEEANALEMLMLLFTELNKEGSLGVEKMNPVILLLLSLSPSC